MAFQPEHIGLYFGNAAIEYAQGNRSQDEDVQRAWQWLTADSGTVLGQREPLDAEDDLKDIIKPDLDGLAAAHVDAFAYRFGESDGALALQILDQPPFASSESPLLDQLMEAATRLHIVELMRAHPQMQSDTLKQTVSQTRDLCDSASTDIVEQMWQMLVSLLASLVAADETAFAEAVQQFCHLVDTQIHPGGYLRDAVQEQPNNTFLRQVLGVCALTLAAEAATQAGTDLWTYENRGVGVATSAAYPLFYFFYPEKWQWEDDLTSAKTRQVFYEHGAFMEIVKSRAELRTVDLLLEQIRPCYSPHAGGLTTLSHPQMARKRRRWFR